MCGIAGSTLADRATLLAMSERLRLRGPDASGLWQDEHGPGGLAHTRLKIIDLSAAAAQPMVSASGRYVLVFNGEIVNFRTLRAELESQGERFRSTSDTEVLLALWARNGAAALRQISGMFAFAVWDREQRELVVVRDRLGIKPVVYAPLADGGLAFASEIAALKAHPGIDLGVDRDAISEYLACLYIPAPRTIHRGIRKLPPGHLLRWRDGRTTVEPYWQPRFEGHGTISFDEAVARTQAILGHAVAEHMVADVPIGCFLSGGVDSSVIAALMAGAAKRAGAPPIKTFTVVFPEAAYDERGPARAVAQHLGAEHRELEATPALGRLLDEHIATFGEPFGNPTALLVHDLARLARQHVSVALVGDGGDEVFAGYPRYRGGLLAKTYRRIPRIVRRGIIEPLARRIPEDQSGRHGPRRIREFVAGASQTDSAMYASWVEYFSPEERGQLLGLSGIPTHPIAAAYDSLGSRHPLDAMQETDVRTFLPGNILAYGDAMSMRHSLELRLPLLDHRVVEAVGEIPAALRVKGGSKAILKAIARRLLPPALVDRPKVGFNPPLSVWLKRDLGRVVDERLTPQSMATLGIDWTPVATLLAEHRTGGRDHALKIWALLALDSWRTQQ
ncbi:MAG: asparagine synthase (glutamine-hydrolyzing) [Rhodospirillales bacterium]|nr:asparagine synthase (glutamine-hydrolyzing) [Rhodospirillales bacterium]